MRGILPFDYCKVVDLFWNDLSWLFYPMCFMSFSQVLTDEMYHIYFSASVKKIYSFLRFWMNKVCCKIKSLWMPFIYTQYIYIIIYRWKINFWSFWWKLYKTRKLDFFRGSLLNVLNIQEWCLPCVIVSAILSCYSVSFYAEMTHDGRLQEEELWEKVKFRFSTYSTQSFVHLLLLMPQVNDFMMIQCFMFH